MADWDEVLGEELRASHSLDEDIRNVMLRGHLAHVSVMQRPAKTFLSRISHQFGGLLKAAGTHLGYKEAGVSTSQSPRLQVLSACTGCSAESFVLKAGRGSSTVVRT